MSFTNSKDVIVYWWHITYMTISQEQALIIVNEWIVVQKVSIDMHCLRIDITMHWRYRMNYLSLILLHFFFQHWHVECENIATNIDSSKHWINWLFHNFNTVHFTFAFKSFFIIIPILFEYHYNKAKYKIQSNYNCHFNYNYSYFILYHFHFQAKKITTIETKKIDSIEQTSESALYNTMNITIPTQYDHYYKFTISF